MKACSASPALLSLSLFSFLPKDKDKDKDNDNCLDKDKHKDRDKDKDHLEKKPLMLNVMKASMILQIQTVKISDPINLFNNFTQFSKTNIKFKIS